MRTFPIVGICLSYGKTYFPWRYIQNFYPHYVVFFDKIVDIFYIDVRDFRDMDKTRFPILQLDKRTETCNACDLTF